MTTHCDRLLEALADGEWHDHLSLYRLGMIVHSRVSELRSRGHAIEHRRDGDLYLYRWLGTLGGRDETRVEQPLPALPVLTAFVPPAEPESGQLVFEVGP
jgi:hypothetical protein